MKKESSDTLKRETLIYGLNPVKEIVEKAPHAVCGIIVPENIENRNAVAIAEMAKSKGIRVKTVASKEFLRLERGRNFQKIAAELKEFEYTGLEEVLKEIKSASKRYPLMIALDSVTDPHNLGAIARTACFFGADCVIIPKDRAASVTPAVIKASSGAVFRIPVVKVVNLARTLDELFERGFLVIGADAKGGTDIRDMKFDEPLVVVFGSEGEGLRKLVREKCRKLVNIPAAGFESLNVSVAAGIIIFCLMSCLTMDR